MASRVINIFLFCRCFRSSHPPIFLQEPPAVRPGYPSGEWRCLPPHIQICEQFLHWGALLESGWHCIPSAAAETEPCRRGSGGEDGRRGSRISERYGCWYFLSVTIVTEFVSVVHVLLPGHLQTTERKVGGAIYCTQCQHSSKANTQTKPSRRWTARCWFTASLID